MKRSKFASCLMAALAAGCAAAAVQAEGITHVEGHGSMGPAFDITAFDAPVHAGTPGPIDLSTYWQSESHHVFGLQPGVYSPAVAVPEPQTWTLLAVGLGRPLRSFGGGTRVDGLLPRVDDLNTVEDLRMSGASTLPPDATASSPQVTRGGLPRWMSLSAASGVLGCGCDGGGGGGGGGEPGYGTDAATPDPVIVTPAEPKTAFSKAGEGVPADAVTQSHTVASASPHHNADLSTRIELGPFTAEYPPEERLGGR